MLKHLFRGWILESKYGFVLYHQVTVMKNVFDFLFMRECISVGSFCLMM